jgi:hypothetical protein
MNEISPILANTLNTALVALVVALITAVWVWTQKTWAQHKKAMTPDVAAEVERYARAAVEFAGQAFKDNAERKEQALLYAQQWLHNVGLGWVDIMLIDAEVERQCGLRKESQAFMRIGR